MENTKCVFGGKEMDGSKGEGFRGIKDSLLYKGRDFEGSDLERLDE